MKTFVAASLIVLAAITPAAAEAPVVVTGHAYEGCSARTPFTNATVRLVATNGEERVLAIDERGFFSVVGLEPGTYDVVLQQKPTRTHAWGPVVPFNPESDAEMASPTLAIRRLTIEAGETATADLGFVRAANGKSTMCGPAIVAVDPPTVDRYTIR